jgi:hypothetical protein
MLGRKPLFHILISTYNTVCTVHIISDSKIILDDIVLQFSEIVKYLGVILDYLLNFNEHIKYTSKKIAKKVGYIYQELKD